MKLLHTLIFALSLPITAFAQSSATIDDILDALLLPELMQIMYDEAMISSEELIMDFAPDKAGAGWTAAMERINDAGRSEALMRSEFSEAFPEEYIERVARFVQSPQARALVRLEVSARKALADPDVEQASIQALEFYDETHPERFAQVARFIEINELVDANVIGALNSNAAFLRGLSTGAGGKLSAGDENEILNDVWAQEPDIRAGTEEWVYSFLMMAYAPASDSDMEAYIAFSESDPGQALNLALFQAFDVLFVQSSRETGEALALLMSSEDI